MDNLSQTLTRKEIVEYLKSSALDSEDNSYFTPEMVKGYEFLLEHLVDEFSDKNLRFNSSTGYFDYCGPELPA